MRRIGKGFSGVDTPLFDGMLVPQQAQDVEDAAEDENDDNEVSVEPTPPSPTHAPTPPPSPTQEHISSPPQAQTAQTSSPPQQQPSQTAEISMTLLNTLLETCATLTKKVANLEQDKIAQAIEITKLKQRVRQLEEKRQYKSSGLKRLRKGGIVELDADEDVTLEDVDAKVAMNAAVQGRLAESQAKVYHLDLEHAEKVFSMQDTDEADPAEEVIEVVTAAKLMTKVVTTAATTITAAQVPKASAPRRRRGVVIQDPEDIATALVIVHHEVKSKDKGKELNANINWDDVMEQVKGKEKQNNTVMRYQALKRKPITKAQARKNMMIYLKNMAGFKMDFFKCVTYNDIRPIFEKHYNSIKAFLEKRENEIEEEGNKRKRDSLNQDVAKKQRIDKETKELKTHLQIVPNDDDDVYTEATHLALKVPDVEFLRVVQWDGIVLPCEIVSRITWGGRVRLMVLFREDLEMLWKLVQERLQSSEPNNFSDVFLLNTLKIMFEKPNVKASIWRDQRGRYELAKVNSWKLFESYGVHILTHNYSDDSASGKEIPFDKIHSGTNVE
nr:hypothetical protein [Tanacetum cinerariifolium]